ncbi:hypothetical protein Hanom_Chr04g00281981 [Helianthus anomalus]
MAYLLLYTKNNKRDIFPPISFPPFTSLYLFHFSDSSTHPQSLPPFTFLSRQIHANNLLRIELRPPLKTTRTTCSDLNPSHRRTSPNHVCSGQKKP